MTTRKDDILLETYFPKNYALIKSKSLDSGLMDKTKLKKECLDLQSKVYFHHISGLDIELTRTEIKKKVSHSLKKQ